MLVSACVLAHPPALVPEVAVDSPGWLQELRTASLDSLARVLAADVDNVVIVGSADGDGRWDESAGGSMAGYGVNIAFGGPAIGLPLSLTIAASLLDALDWRGPRSYLAVASTTPSARAAQTGRDLVAARPSALVVMGDGSAKRSKHAPGYLDDRAADFDASVVKALAAADGAALEEIDRQLATELWVAGRPAWQVLAGALSGSFKTRVSYNDAPTGVGYFVVELTAS